MRVSELEDELGESDVQLDALSRELAELNAVCAKKDLDHSASQNALALLRVKVLSTAEDQEELLDLVECRTAEM